MLTLEPWSQGQQGEVSSLGEPGLGRLTRGAWPRGREGRRSAVGKELAGLEGPLAGKFCFFLLGNSSLGSIFEAELITESSHKGC